MKRSWQWKLGSLAGGALAVSLLGGCGVSAEPGEKEGAPVGEVTSGVGGNPCGTSGGLAGPVDAYADSVLDWATSLVIAPDNAVGAPDGKVATLHGLSTLTLDLGAGEEGLESLKLYYVGSAPTWATVEFFRADGVLLAVERVSSTGTEQGRLVATVPYTKSTGFRWVKVRGALLATYQVDAVAITKLGTGPCAFCGDGVIQGVEVCDDKNLLSGDGCNSVCQVEPGYTCRGSPSVCDDNWAPTVEDVQGTTLEDTPLGLTIPAEDVEGDALTFTFTTPGHGTLTGTGPSVTYTPDEDFAGEDVFQVTVSDGENQVTATVTITVQPVNDAPVAVNDTAATDEDAPLTLEASTLLANDSDVDGPAALTLGAVQNATHGTVTLSGTSVTFVPEDNFHGTATFEYVVTDGQASSTAQVSVTVNPVNDAPVATSAAVTVSYNTATPITVSATDVDGDALTFSFTAPAHGTLSGTGPQLLYTPAADFHGEDQFTFTASDGSLTSAVATVSITVRAPPACGDSHVDPGEVCDDGNRVAGDGCRADCRGVEVCGDGLVDSAAGEQCDDGGTTAGDGCDATCQLDAFSNVPPTLVSGTLSCTTANTHTGRKVAVDALGRFYVVMRCGGEVHVSVSVDRGQTWVGPTPLGITGAAEVAIEGGPTGVAYVAATASPGVLMFTRTIDAGASWEAPRTLASAVNPTVSLDSMGDALYISLSRGGSAGVRVFRNFTRGANDFVVTDVDQRNAFHDVIVDKISGDIFSVSDDPSFRIRRSSDQAASFGPLSSPPGQAFFSDWTGSNGFLYVTGSNGDNNVDVIPVSAPGTSTQVPGLPSDIGPGSFRTIDADALGNGYIASQLQTGDIQLDRMMMGASTILATDVRPLGSGAAPAVAALPSNGGALVAFTNGTSVYAAVVVY